MVAMRLGVNTYAGEQIGDGWYYVFKAYRDIDDDAPESATPVAGAAASAATSKQKIKASPEQLNAAHSVSKSRKMSALGDPYASGGLGA